MGVHLVLRMKPVSGHEVLIGADGNRRWPDEMRGHLVAAILVPGVTVNQGARRYAAQSFIGMGSYGALPDLSGAAFVPVKAIQEPTPVEVSTPPSKR